MFRLSILYWALGRPEDSEAAIGRALQRFPRHPGVWNTRMFLYAFSERTEAAGAMFDDRESRPPALSDSAIAVWRSSLQALRTRAPDDIAAARAANVGAALKSPGFAVNATMILSMLGELDAAFEVVRGYLLRRGPLIGSPWTGSGQLRVNDQNSPKTMMLFVPATQAMRADRRFDALCDSLGFNEYWQRRGVTPDFRRRA
jgi:hypothetical protein